MSAIQELLPAETHGLAVYNEFRARVAELHREEAALVFDYETSDGEKAARSHVYKLRQTKAPVDAARKAEKAASLEYGRKVDAEGNAIIALIDAMIERHVAPLREKDKRESSRVEAHRLIIDYIKALQGDASQSSEFLAAQCKSLAAIVVDESLEEFRDEAAIAYVERSEALQAAFHAAVKREQEEVELDALRAEKVERDRKDREAQIATDAAAKAKADAEITAKHEVEAAALREKAANERAAHAEAEARVAQERVATAAQEATARAAREAQAVSDKLAVEQKAREENLEHRKAINNAVLSDLIEFAGVTEKTGKMVILALFSGKVRHLRLEY